MFVGLLVHKSKDFETIHNLKQIRIKKKINSKLMKKYNMIIACRNCKINYANYYRR